MVVYTILNENIIGIRNQQEPYTLLENERGSTVWYLKPFYNINTDEVEESITQQEIDERLSDAKDSKLDELHIIVNKELETLQSLINDNTILTELSRPIKPIPPQARNWASSVLDQQETIENEIQALTTIEEVNSYIIIIE